VNVSAVQAALNRWTATDKRWNKKVVSRGSVVASVKRLLICARNSWALTLIHSFIRSFINLCQEHEQYMDQYIETE